MSAIVAGESCKICKKEYWYSFGHPKWYDDVVQKGLEKSEEYLEYEELSRSGMCMSCYIDEWIKETSQDGRE